MGVNYQKDRLYHWSPAKGGFMIYLIANSGRLISGVQVSGTSKFWAELSLIFDGHS